MLSNTFNRQKMYNYNLNIYFSHKWQSQIHTVIYKYYIYLKLDYLKI